MLHLLEQGYRVIDTAAWPGSLDPGDHSMDLVESRIAALADERRQTALQK